MAMRFDSLVFPGGKTKAFTLSYDDGVIQDRRLAEIFRRNGLKCSFNLNSGLFGTPGQRQAPDGRMVDVSRLPENEIPAVYQGHEICGHGLFHSLPDCVGTPRMMHEIIEDKRRLEAISEKPLKMFAYPFGNYNDDVVRILSLAGYRGARTVRSTHSFDIPENFLTWDPTCHHDDPQLMELGQRFLAGASRKPMLFYLWGHAYEFDLNRNWEVIESFCDFMGSHSDEVWFASNGEIIDLVTAWQRLEYSADGMTIYNPSATDVTIRLDNSATALLPAGKITRLA